MGFAVENDHTALLKRIRQPNVFCLFGVSAEADKTQLFGGQDDFIRRPAR